MLEPVDKNPVPRGSAREHGPGDGLAAAIEGPLPGCGKESIDRPGIVEGIEIVEMCVAAPMVLVVATIRDHEEPSHGVSVSLCNEELGIGVIEIGVPTSNHAPNPLAEAGNPLWTFRIDLMRQRNKLTLEPSIAWKNRQDGHRVGHAAKYNGDTAAQ